MYHYSLQYMADYTFLVDRIIHTVDIGGHLQPLTRTQTFTDDIDYAILVDD